jgi:hypothetical protein
MTNFEHSKSTDALSLRTLNEFTQEGEGFPADLTNSTDLPLSLPIDNERSASLSHKNL